MTNMIQAARNQVAALTQTAYEQAAAAGVLPAGAQVKATVEIPKDTSHGDYASSFAMAGAKALHMAPRAIAQAIVDEYNGQLGVSRAQAAAMLAGAMFGWEVPAADPKNYDKEGQPIKPKHHDRGNAR